VYVCTLNHGGSRGTDKQPVG